MRRCRELGVSNHPQEGMSIASSERCLRHYVFEPALESHSVCWHDDDSHMGDVRCHLTNYPKGYKIKFGKTESLSYLCNRRQCCCHSKSQSYAQQHRYTAQESANGFGSIQRCSTPWLCNHLHCKLRCTLLRRSDAP